MVTSWIDTLNKVFCVTSFKWLLLEWQLIGDSLNGWSSGVTLEDSLVTGVTLAVVTWECGTARV
jgi:hypothetical protein